MLQRQHHLHETRDTGSSVEMSDVALHRSERTVADAVRGRTKCLRERLDLDRVTNLCSGAVRLDGIDVTCVDAGDCECLGNRLGMAVDARREVADFACTIVVDSRPLDHGTNVVAVGECIVEPPQHHDAGTVSEHRAVGVRVERSAVSVPGEDLTLLVQVATVLLRIDGRSTGEREIALPRQQALAGLMNRDQRRRACRLDVDAGTAKVEEVGDPSGEKVLVVVGVTEQEPAHRLHEVGVRDQVVDQVRVHATAGEHADRSVEPMWVVTGVLERLPDALEEVAMLGIHHRRLAW